MATDFSQYNKMPILDKGANPWFDNKIKKLGLNIKNGFVVEITDQNSALVENSIKENDDYNANFIKKIYEYHEMKNNGVFPRTGSNAKEAVLDVVRMIDLENNTNIWRFKTKRPYLLNMVDFMIDGSKVFWTKLEKGDKKLVDLLIDKSGAIDTDGPKSLASKICKYISEVISPGKDYYYINDHVVRHVLPYYLNYYGIKMHSKNKTDFESISYVRLFQYLDKIKKKTQVNLSKSKIDHILWYCYRYQNFDKFDTK